MDDTPKKPEQITDVAQPRRTFIKQSLGLIGGGALLAVLQDAVALANNASNQLNLTGTTVSGGAGILSQQRVDAEDADITMRLKEKFDPILKANGLEELFDQVENPLIRVLTEMEFWEQPRNRLVLLIGLFGTGKSSFKRRLPNATRPKSTSTTPATLRPCWQP